MEKSIFAISFFQTTGTGFTIEMVVVLVLWYIQYNTITLLVSQCLQARVAFFETRNFMDLKPKHVKWLMTPKFFNSFVFASKKQSKKLFIISLHHCIQIDYVFGVHYRETIKNVILQFPCPIAMPMYRSECIIKTVHKVRNNSL